MQERIGRWGGPWKLVVAVLLGAAAWISLVVVPAAQLRAELKADEKSGVRELVPLGEESSDVPEDWTYELTLPVLGFVMGIAWPLRRSNQPGSQADYMPGLVLALPALLLAGWTAPRGDGDGLSSLIFLNVAFAGLLAMCGHRLGALLNRRWLWRPNSS